jgi:hypothetical protein
MTIHPQEQVIMTKTLHFYGLMMIVAREAIEIERREEEAIEIERREEEAIERARMWQQLSTFESRDCDRAAAFGY